MELEFVLLIIIFSTVMVILLNFKWQELEEIREEKEKPHPTILEEFGEESKIKPLLENFEKKENELAIPLGITPAETVKNIDFNKVNNLLMIGTTGGGKSICLNEIITSLSLLHSKDEIKIVTMDTSIVELSSFNGIAHYIKDTISIPKEMKEELRVLKLEAEKRIQNQTQPSLLVIIDDLYDIYSYDPSILKELEYLLSISKEANMHWLLATDTPSKKIITDSIKEKMDAAIISPEAKPKNRLFNLSPTFFLNKKTIALPKVVIKNINVTPKKVINVLFNYSLLCMRVPPITI